MPIRTATIIKRSDVMAIVVTTVTIRITDMVHTMVGAIAHILSIATAAVVITTNAKNIKQLLV